MKRPAPVMAAIVAVLMMSVSPASSVSLNVNKPTAAAPQHAHSPSAPPTTAELAARGDAEAQYILGNALMQHKPKPKTEREALVWLTLSAVGGNVHAALATAHYYAAHGNDHEAARWWYRAGQLDDGQARQRFMEMFLAGKAQGIGGRDGVAWLTERAITTRNSDIKLAIGNAFEKGMGVPPDAGEADHWFRDAAFDGNVEAMARLGARRLFAPAAWRISAKETGKDGRWTGAKFYPTDPGAADLGRAAIAKSADADVDQVDFVRPGMTEGEQWLRRAAIFGSSAAKVQLARAAFDGITLPLRPWATQRLLLAAACDGNIEALTVLARMNATESNGAPRNALRAWVFWDVAARLGDTESEGDRDWIAHALSARQLTRAKAIAQDWCAEQ